MVRWMRATASTFLLLAIAGPAAAQGGPPLQVQGIRTLAFGSLLPGVPTTVARTDPARAGRFDIRGRRNTRMIIMFGLPTALRGPGAAMLPLAFGASDAGFSPNRSIGAQSPFDPRTAFSVTLPNNGHCAVYLGGRAQPSPTQPPGAYTAAVTLIVAYDL